MKDTSVEDVMTKNPEFIEPDATLEQACIRMKDINCGILPVALDDKIEGVITDRDIIIRAIAAGVDPGLALVKDYMTVGMQTCKSGHTLKEAAQLMNDKNVSRLLVRGDDGTITGILTFGRLLRSDADDTAVNQAISCASGRDSSVH